MTRSTLGIIARLNSSEGSVLIAVLVSLSVLSIIIVTLMTLALSSYSAQLARHNLRVASHLSESGIARFLSRDPGAELLETKSWSVIEVDGSIQVRGIPWGPFLMLISDGTKANQTVRTTSVIGSQPTALFHDAVTITDINLPLVLTGNSHIIGNVNVGPLGLSTGRIRGEGIIDTNYHRGTVNVYEAMNPPAIDTVVLRMYYENMKRHSRVDGTELRGSAVIKTRDALFKSGENVTHVENNLELRNVAFSDYGSIRTIAVGGGLEFRDRTSIGGTIEFFATLPIRVKDSTYLDGVILYSTDSIIIEDNAYFSGIAISETAIVVRDQATLQYPSCLIVDGSMDDNTIHNLSLSSRAKLEAMLCMLSKANRNTTSADLIYIDTVSTLQGYVLSDSQVDIRGRLFGTLVTKSFHYYLHPTTYINWLKDATIDRSRLSYTPALPLLISDDSQRFRIIRQDMSNAQ